MVVRCSFHKDPKTSKSSEKRKGGHHGLSEEEEAARLSALRQDLLKQRAADWADCWQQKIKEAQREEDLKARCAPGVYFRKPRAQTNIWCKVEHAKNTQSVELCFKTVPVSKPKAPPVPRLREPNLLKPLSRNESGSTITKGDGRKK